MFLHLRQFGVFRDGNLKLPFFVNGNGEKQG